MDCARVSYSRHALERMFARSIRPDQISVILREGAEIESYPNDTPYPSQLLVGRSGAVWLHVVVAYSQADRHCIVVTAYIPDASMWDESFRTRRRP